MPVKDELVLLKEQIATNNVKLEEQKVVITKVHGETKGLKTSNQTLAAKIAELEEIIRNGGDNPEVLAALEEVKTAAAAQTVIVADIGTSLGAVDTEVDDAP